MQRRRRFLHRVVERRAADIGRVHHLDVLEPEIFGIENRAQRIGEVGAEHAVDLVLVDAGIGERVVDRLAHDFEMGAAGQFAERRQADADHRDGAAQRMSHDYSLPAGLKRTSGSLSSGADIGLDRHADFHLGRGNAR